MRTGILGGTFDPIHMGHLEIARVATMEANLDEVVFVPTGEPWLKAGVKITASDQRAKMVEMAIEDNPQFRMSSVEIDRSGPTYTVDTLIDLNMARAEINPLFFILGLDSLAMLHLWREPQRIFELCTLIAISRPGHGQFNLSSLDEIQRGVSKEVIVINGPNIEISGKDIRHRVSQGLTIKGWVPEKIEEHIRTQGLYEEGTIG